MKRFELIGHATDTTIGQIVTEADLDTKAGKLKHLGGAERLLGLKAIRELPDGPAAVATVESTVTSTETSTGASDADTGDGDGDTSDGDADETATEGDGEHRDSPKPLTRTRKR